MANRNPNYKEDAKKGGRPKGIPNKINIDIKNMIMEALEDAGGKQYLIRQAEENPGAFMGLVSKIIPKDINANVSGEIKLVRVSTGIPRSPKDGSG
jgi:hypothetical protein